MQHAVSRSRKAFLIVNGVFLGLLTAACIIPVVNVLATSLSSPTAVDTGRVYLWPVGLNVDAYSFVMRNSKFWRAVLITFERIAIGVPLNMILIVFSAYPLSRRLPHFKARKYYSAYYIFSILFSGGLIPTYLVVVKTGLINSLFSLVLPSAVGVFSVILVMNFFRTLPGEIAESASIDGAGHFRVLFSLYVPLSKPALATVLLFALLGHWNAWFDGLIYLNNTEKYPLQSYLQTVLIASTQFNIDPNADLAGLLARLKTNSRTLRAAQIFISMVPILVVYPYLQRYFTTGIVLGSVKG